MIPTKTLGMTHAFSAPENWDADKDGKCGTLEVRMQLVGESRFVELVSTWKPSAEELAVLNAGGVIEIALAQATQCVMRAYVVEPVKEG